MKTAAVLVLVLAGCRASSSATTRDGGSATADAPSAPSPDTSAVPEVMLASADLSPTDGSAGGSADAGCPASAPAGRCAQHSAVICRYPEDAGELVCNCAASNGEWTCGHPIPRCPPTPGAGGAYCATGETCRWFVGCALVQCRCGVLDYKRGTQWFCSTGPPPDGGPESCDGGLPQDR